MGLPVRVREARLAGTPLGLNRAGVWPGPTAVTYSLLITLVNLLGTGAIGGILESLRFFKNGPV